MAGRRRRRSHSTVATADASPPRFTKEDVILKPVLPGVAEDKWTCFVLQDAEIYHKDGTRLANPLFVDLEGPLIIRGHFHADEPDQELCRMLLHSSAARLPCSADHKR